VVPDVVAAGRGLIGVMFDSKIGDEARAAAVKAAGRGRVRVGMIGAGMVGQVAHLANLVQNPACEVVALAELRPGLGRLAAEKFGVKKVYASHRELLADPAIDAVVVVTRRPATGPIVLDALNAGKHVLSEKPMAHTVAQGEKLVAAAAARHLHYAVGYMKRHDAGTAEAKRLLDDLCRTRELGRVVLVRAYCHGGAFACGPDSYVMTDETRPDGLLLWPEGPDWLPAARHADYAWFLNVYSHDVNLLRYLLGRPLQVKAADVARRAGGAVIFDAGDYPVTLDYAEVKFDSCTEGVEILFERGRLALRFPSPMLRNVPAEVTVEKAGEGTTSRAVPWSWCFRRQADDFIADILFGRAPLAGGADALEDLRLVEQIWRRQLDAEHARGGAATETHQ
jgi:predicted dehydrogenase